MLIFYRQNKVNKTLNGLSSSLCLDMLEDLLDLRVKQSLYFFIRILMTTLNQHLQYCKMQNI